MQRNLLLLAGVAVGLSALSGKHFIESKIETFSAGRSISLKPVEASYHGQSLKKYDAGFHQFFSGLFWVKLLQNASYQAIEDDKVSWEFAELDAITTLDPFFIRAYSYGHAFLSVFRRDKIGAEIILKKWTKIQPEDWRTHYFYGYHLFFELDKYNEAAPHILKAASMERAPHWLSSLGVRLLEQGLAYEQALKNAVELLNQSENPVAQQRLSSRVRALNFGMQKQRWVSALGDYRRAKHREPSSLSELIPFQESSRRQLASLMEGVEVKAEVANLLRENFPFRYDTAKKEIIAIEGAQTKGLEKLGIYTPNKDAKKEKK